MLLSIDPSSTEVGWAVFNVALKDYGIISATKKRKWERFEAIVKALNSICNYYGVTEVACERVPPAITKNKKYAAEALIVAFRCIKDWSKERRLPLFIYSPGEWKRSVIGYHLASKEQVARIIYLQYPKLPRDLPFHVTDAIAIGLMRIGEQRLNSMIARDMV